MEIEPEPGFTVIKQVKKETTRASGLIVPGEITNLVVVLDSIPKDDDPIDPGTIVIASLKEAIKYELEGDTFLVIPRSAIMASVL